MKCFLINLDKNPERLEYMDRQLKALDVPYERFPGVYGKELDGSDLKKCFASFRSFCVEGRRMVLGEIGCALSHVGVYRRILRDNLPYALVLEDDVMVLPEFPSALKKIEDLIEPDKPQVYMLSCHGYGFEKNCEKKAGIEAIGGATSADAYCISRAAAALIAKSNFPVVSVADRWSRWRKHLKLKLFRLWPVVAAQDRVTWHLGVSNIRYQRKTLSGVRKVWHKLNRCWQVAIDNLMFAVCRH